MGLDVIVAVGGPPASALGYDFYLPNVRSDLSGRGALIAGNTIYTPRLPDMGDAEIVAATRLLREYLPWSPDARLLHASVHRLPMTIPAPRRAGHRGHAPPHPSMPIAGSMLAGDWMRTGLPCSMESAVRSAWTAADAIPVQADRPAAWVQPLRQPHGLAGLVARRRVP